MSNFWANVKPADVLDDIKGMAGGFAFTMMDDSMNDLSFVDAQKALMSNNPRVVGEWNLKWLVYPSIETYFRDPACFSEEGGYYPKPFWERFLLLRTLLDNDGAMTGKPLWEIAAETTPLQFVEMVIPRPEKAQAWLRKLFQAKSDHSGKVVENAYQLLAESLGVSDDLPPKTPEGYLGWVEEVWKRAQFWEAGKDGLVLVSPTKQDSDVSGRVDNVIHVQFGHS